MRALSLAAAALLVPLLIPCAARAQTRNSWYGTSAAVSPGVQQVGDYTLAATATGSSQDGSGFASADIPSGKLHATATSSSIIPDTCLPGACGWAVYSAAYAWDAVTVTVPAGQTSRLVTWSFTIDGSVTRGRFGGYGSAEAYYYFGTGYAGWMGPHSTSVGNDTLRLTGSFTVGTVPTAIYFFSGLSVMAANSASADYGNTMRFEWTAPEGSVITSQSGAFIMPSNFAPVTATPEPAPLALLGAGLGAVALTLRRRAEWRRRVA